MISSVRLQNQWRHRLFPWYLLLYYQLITNNQHQIHAKDILVLFIFFGSNVPLSLIVVNYTLKIII